MSKIKRLIPALLSVVFAFAIFAAACDTQETVDQNALISIEIDTLNVQTSFEYGEKFSSENLAVTATLRDIDTGEESRSDVTRSAKVDSTNYNANSVGTYDIHVSYTHAGVTRTASYKVSVKPKEPPFSGLTVEYASGYSDRVTLATGISVTMIVPELVVKKVGDDGIVDETPLSESEYRTELYLGNEKQNGWMVGGGAYEIRVYLVSDPNVFCGIVYYVIDNLFSIAWNSTAAGTQTTIERWSSDKEVIAMAHTWSFTATYVSGATKTVTVADEGVSYDCNVDTAGVKQVSVSYVDDNAIGQTIGKSTNVTITVSDIDADITSYDYNLDELTSEMKSALDRDTLGDNLQLHSSYFTGKNSFLTFIEDGSSSADQYRSSGLIEIKGGRLQVEFQGKGAIEIEFSSTGSSNTSGLVLIDKDGKYVSGRVKEGNAVELAEDDADGNLKGLFTVTGTGHVTIRFFVEEPGIYTIYSLYSSGSTRGCRLYGIHMTDVVMK